MGEAEQPADTPSALDRFKALAGTWEGTATHHGGEPEPATVAYAVTAGGSAVVETVFVGAPHEMVTVYHMDEDRLVLTHYCMLSNQPTMAAEPGESPDTVHFEFTGGTNIDTGQEMHMHSVDYTFSDEDHFIATWTLHDQGEPVGQAVLDLHRVQSEN